MCSHTLWASHTTHNSSWCIVQQRSIAGRPGGRNSPHLLLLQVDHDLGRPQSHLLHEVQVLVPATTGRGTIKQCSQGRDVQNVMDDGKRCGPQRVACKCS